MMGQVMTDELREKWSQEIADGTCDACGMLKVSDSSAIDSNDLSHCQCISPSQVARPVQPLHSPVKISVREDEHGRTKVRLEDL